MFLLNRWSLSFAAIGVSVFLVSALKTRVYSDPGAHLTAKPISAELESSIVGGAGIYRKCIEYPGIPTCDKGEGINYEDPTGNSCSDNNSCPVWCPGAPKGKVVGPPPLTVVKWYGYMCGWVTGTAQDKCVDTISNFPCTKHTFVCDQQTRKCQFSSSAEDANACGNTWVCF